MASPLPSPLQSQQQKAMQGAAALQLEQQEWQELGWAVTGLPACAAAAHLAAAQWAQGRPSQPSTGAFPTRPSPLPLQQHTVLHRFAQKISLLILQLLLPLCRKHSCGPILGREVLDQGLLTESDERKVQERSSRALAVS